MIKVNLSSLSRARRANVDSMDVSNEQSDPSQPSYEMRGSRGCGQSEGGNATFREHEGAEGGDGDGDGDRDGKNVDIAPSASCDLGNVGQSVQ